MQNKTMKTDTVTSLASFCEASHLNPSLVRAVVRQFGGWESFKESAPDVCRGGIDSGFHGFIYHRDTEAFAKRNRSLIQEAAEEMADSCGMGGAIGLVQGFGCFRGQDVTEEEVAVALYQGRNPKSGLNVLNALAWYAGEEVCRSYTDLTESN